MIIERNGIINVNSRFFSIMRISIFLFHITRLKIKIVYVYFINYFSYLFIIFEFICIFSIIFVVITTSFIIKSRVINFSFNNVVVVDKFQTMFN